MVNFQYTLKETSKVFNVRDTDVLKIQVLEDQNVNVEASLNGENFEKLTGFRDTNLEKVNAITKKGIYTYDINGFEWIRVSKAGSTDVILVGVN